MRADAHAQRQARERPQQLPGRRPRHRRSGITVDLNGHTIDGVATQIEDCDVSPFGSAGIQNSGGYDGLTIKNGTLQQFFSGFNAGSDTEACPTAGSCTSSPATTASAA